MKFGIVSRHHFWNDEEMMMIFALAAMPQPTLVAPSAQVQEIRNYVPDAAPEIPEVPFYSQFKDISSAKWQKVGCGITSLAMIVDYYSTDAISVNTMLSQGLSAGAYLQNAGWTYAGLISVAKKYGLDGNSYDLGGTSANSALKQMKVALKDGPIIASVHYKMDPKSKIPHLVVIDGIKGDTIYYNDPAAKTGTKEISTADFLKAWKKRYIVVRPVAKTLARAT